jgi:hypothetical protein
MSWSAHTAGSLGHLVISTWKNGSLHRIQFGGPRPAASGQDRAQRLGLG